MKYSKRNKIALFLLATILFMQSVLFPITTYASKNTAEEVQRAAQEAAEAAIGQVTAGGSGRVDSEGNEYEYYPGELYWAGTEERTTLLVYLVNNKTGQYIGNDYAIMLFQDEPIPDTLLDSNSEPWLDKITTKGGTIRCGNKNRAYDVFRKQGYWVDGSKYNMPAVASFTGNPDGIKNWLEETLDDGENCGITGLRMIDKIIIKEIGYDAFKKTCPSESGDPEYAVVFESCSANMIYRNVRQDSQGAWICSPDKSYSANTLQHNTGDPRIYYWGTPRSHAEWLINFGGGQNSATSNAGIHSDIQTGSGQYGIANWKWYQSYFRYFGVTRDYWGDVILCQNKKSDELITLGEAYKYGWAVGVAEPPQIPLGTCNDSTPGNTEEITEYTKGNKNGKKGTKGVIV